jgi:hypothetical protein
MDCDFYSQQHKSEALSLDRFLVEAPITVQIEDWDNDAGGGDLCYRKCVLVNHCRVSWSTPFLLGFRPNSQRCANSLCSSRFPVGLNIRFQHRVHSRLIAPAVSLKPFHYIPIHS